MPNPHACFRCVCLHYCSSIQSFPGSVIKEGFRGQQDWILVTLWPLHLPSWSTKCQGLRDESADSHSSQASRLLPLTVGAGKILGPLWNCNRNVLWSSRLSITSANSLVYASFLPSRPSQGDFAGKKKKKRKKRKERKKRKKGKGSRSWYGLSALLLLSMA